MEIITADEADQIIRLKQPLGLDYQGRHPEARPVPDEDEDDSGYELVEGLMSWPCLVSMAFAVMCLCIVLYAAGVRV